MNNERNFLKWVEISESALIHNIEIFKSKAPESEPMAVVKSNAYGHGIVETATIAARHGIKWLGVNELDEALKLRTCGLTTPSILVMGSVLPSTTDTVVSKNIKTIVYTEDLVRALSQSASSSGKTAFVHIKVETGLNRQGVDISKLEAFCSLIDGLPNIELEGISTHFANIEDTTDHSYARRQISLFNKAIDICSKYCKKELIAHCACSAAALAVPQTGYSLLRMGIGMYGLWPSKETQLSVLSSGTCTSVQLKPVMAVKCRIAQVKNVGRGSLIGYGCTEEATHDLRLAVLPVGYFDGIDRRMSSKGQVLINGHRAYIRGRICMNMCMVDVSHIDSVKKGDAVTLLGSENGQTVSADLIASQLGTINYEVVTGIGQHLPRIIVD